MNFAREQLEKHGWKHGQGLGKEEKGIKEPVKVKIKNDTTGVGHDAGKEFTFHWWDHMFNKAARSIQVETTENGVHVKKLESAKIMKDTTVKTYDNKNMLYAQFVKGATLSDGRYKAEENVVSQNDSNHEEPSKSAIIPANEEELFRQCGGRTAHKGARHGLKLNGKLARIEQQEQELLDRLTNKSANQKSENSVLNDGIGQIPANEISNKKKNKKRKIKEENDEEVTDCRNKETLEAHGKTCKKKRKKKKHKKKSENKLVNGSQNSSDSESVENSRGVEPDEIDNICKDSDNLNLANLEADYNDSEPNVLRTSKKLKKKKKKKKTKK